MRPPTGKFFGTSDRLSGLNFVVCLVIDGFSIDRIWANCACDILKYSKKRSLASILSHLSPSHHQQKNKRSRISRRLLYPAIIDDALR